MQIAILGATGATGRQLTIQALERGHGVVALARNPASLDIPATGALEVVAADVHDQDSVARAIAGVDVVVSGLGIRSKGETGTLVAGARALVAAAPPRIIWLGALGIGESRPAISGLFSLILNMAIGSQAPEKIEADAILRKAGATIFHAGVLNDDEKSPTAHSVRVSEVPRKLFQPGISRATVASAMLDEAERNAHPGELLVPQS